MKRFWHGNSGIFRTPKLIILFINISIQPKMSLVRKNNFVFINSKIFVLGLQNFTRVTTDFVVNNWWVVILYGCNFKKSFAMLCSEDFGISVLEQLFEWWNFDFLKNIFLLIHCYFCHNCVWRARSIISTVLKSAILYKILNNPTQKMHLSEIQLEKFMRHIMNMNKNFFSYLFRVFSLATRTKALNEIYVFFSCEVTHFDGVFVPLQRLGWNYKRSDIWLSTSEILLRWWRGKRGI